MPTSNLPYLTTLPRAGVEESLLVPLEGFTGVLSLARAAMGREEGGGGELCTCVCVCVECVECDVECVECVECV